MSIIYEVSVAPGFSWQCTIEKELDLNVGDLVIVKTERCQDNGKVIAINKGKPSIDQSSGNSQKDGGGKAAQPESKNEDNAKRGSESAAGDGSRKKKKKRSNQLPKGRILRRVNSHDETRIEEKRAREKFIFQNALRKVREHNLQMKMLNCHYSFDRTVVYFQFAAEGRVDFRRLVKDLSGALHVRVELRQVGVRDETALVGGIGCCGRPLCCASFLDKFPPVSVKAAKEQHLSLNPSSVSGSCGRLKCCLRYELEGYRKLNKQLPRMNARCRIEAGEGRVVDCNALAGTVKVRLVEDPGRCLDVPADQVQTENREQNDNAKNQREDG